MAEDGAPRHANTLSSLNIVHEHNKLNARATRTRVLEFPLRKQGAVISLSGSRDRDVVSGNATVGGERRRESSDRARKVRKISSLSVPEGKDAKDALVLLQNGNHGDSNCYLAEDSAEEEDDDDDDDEDEDDDDEDEDDVEDGDEDTDVAAVEGAESSVSGRHRVPDGGWGWAVVAAAFFINMASDGISFSFGLLYIEFLRYFGQSRSDTAWIGSLFMAVPMLTGPVASAMVDRYGCRAMTIVGGVISALGFVIASSASTIGQMYLTFGLLAGLGLGLCFITAVVSIAFWFERKRTLAMSLGAAGTGFGTFIYAPMTNYCISEYGWRGTVLLLAGTFLNLCLCGVVMRDPSWWAVEQEQAAQGRRGRGAAAPGAGSTQGQGGSEPAVHDGASEASELLPLAPLPPLPPLAVPLSRVARSLPYTRAMSMTTRSEDNLASMGACPPRQAASAPPTPSTPVSPPPFGAAPATPGPLAFNTIPELEVPEHVLDEDAGGHVGSTPMLTGPAPPPQRPSYLNLLPGPGAGQGPGPGPGRGPGPGGSVAGAVAGVVAGAMHVPGPGHVRRSASSGPFPLSGSPLRAESLPCFRRRVSLSTTPGTPLYAAPSASFPLQRRDRRKSSLGPGRGRASWRACCPPLLGGRGEKGAAQERRWYSTTVELVRAMMDFSLFLELHFLLMSVGTTLLYTWFVVPYFYLADHLIENGYTQADASHMLGVVGYANTFGMLVLGCVGDHPRLNVTKTYALCLAVCGTATAGMLVFTKRYWLLTLSCAAFGVTFGSTFSFTPTILVTLVPMERFTIAYGLNLLCQGIGNLLGPPFAGWLFDLTHSWDWSFYMAGLWIVVAGLLTGLISYTNNRTLFSSLAAGAGAGLAGNGRAQQPAADAEAGDGDEYGNASPSKSPATATAAAEVAVPVTPIAADKDEVRR
ncbi:Monocarboxylate transporter 12 [Frankliniella fusca]|uniref:Monocarboxylate transporter 12 n=1 Tax=Frankliniella fusca TaxID=407009 RepID=A0AAE1HW44_9NEOP|nr:Monocarboxylate transporter 12 [Frankliniella fusca]